MADNGEEVFEPPFNQAVSDSDVAPGYFWESAPAADDDGDST